RTNRAVELRSSQPVEKSAVETLALNLPHRATIAVGQDGLWAVGSGGDLAEFFGDFVEGEAPRDRDELPCPFAADAAERVQESLRMINPFKVPRHLVAQEAARGGMLAVAGQRHGAVAFQGDQHGAGVRAIMRADRADGADSRHCNKYIGS